MEFNWRKVVGAVAPALGTALGGPLGFMAGGLVAEALGVENPEDEEAMAQAMKCATPEQLAALKQADANFKVRMKELDVDLERLASEDRASARARQATTGDKTPAYLAMLVTGGFFGLLGWMMYQAPPDGSAVLLNIMLGALGAAWTSVIAYYFGSSAGSAQKTAMLSQAKGA